MEIFFEKTSQKKDENQNYKNKNNYNCERNSRNSALESRLTPKRLEFQIQSTFTKTLKHRNCDQSKLQKNQKSEWSWSVLCKPICKQI